MVSTRTPEEVAAALAAPFDPNDVHFKPTAVSGNRALAVAYVDARAIQDRLDAVVGVANWKDDYTPQPDGNVLCRLSVRIDGEWITKSDAGGPGDMQDAGDRLKSATSDSLKRAAVKFSIGRYLYHLGGQWVDYDPKRKQFTSKPQLPSWAIPGKSNSPPAQQPTPAKAANGSPAKPNVMPETGEELEKRLAEYDAKLAAEGLWVAGDLLRHVTQVVSKAGPKGHSYGGDVRKWPEQAIRLAVGEAKDFEQRARAKEERRQATEKRLTEPREANKWNRPEEDPVPY